jgi:hypothetical protein
MPRGVLERERDERERDGSLCRSPSLEAMRCLQLMIRVIKANISQHDFFCRFRIVLDSVKNDLCTVGAVTVNQWQPIGRSFLGNGLVTILV